MTELFDTSSFFYDRESPKHDFDWYYDDLSIDDIDLEFGDKIYHGRDVIWIGPEGSMFKAVPSMTSPWKYNAFDIDKMRAIRNRIMYGSSPVLFFSPPYAEVYAIGREEISETQNSMLSGHFEED